MADRPCDCAYVWKVHCAVVGTASGSVQGRSGTRYAVAIRKARKTRTDWPSRHNNLNKSAPGRPIQNISAYSGVGVLRKRCVTFDKYLTGKGASSTNQCWCQKTIVIAVSCGIKISAVHHSALSQYTHLTDGRTDGQNCDSNTVRCHTCSRTVKNRTRNGSAIVDTSLKVS